MKHELDHETIMLLARRLANMAREQQELSREHKSFNDDMTRNEDNLIHFSKSQALWDAAEAVMNHNFTKYDLEPETQHQEVHA
jgi:sensor domain CHASE-containing protein